MLIQRLEDGNGDADDLGVQLTQHLAMQGHHRKRIAELQSRSHVSVTFRTRKCVRWAVLRPGVLTRASFLKSPIIWCPLDHSVVDSKVHEVVSNDEITESLPTSLACAKHTIARGDGISYSMVGQRSSFTIVAKDEKKNDVGKCGYVFVLSCNDIKMDYTMQDLQNGDYRVMYNADRTKVMTKSIWLSVCLGTVRYVAVHS